MSKEGGFSTLCGDFFDELAKQNVEEATPPPSSSVNVIACGVR
jgi:hypothetical protein